MNAKPSDNFSFVVTCEHASDTIPEICRTTDLDTLMTELETHRVYDVGAREVSEAVAARLGVAPILGNICRLAIDLNRSLGTAGQFSPPILNSSEFLKGELIEKHFLPFRHRTVDQIDSLLAAGSTVIHISVHSFTKVFNGTKRETDIGILYDPNRSLERKIGKSWVELLSALWPDHVTHDNQPYEGQEDGHTTALRKRYPEDSYIGLEIELSQDLDLANDAELWAKLLLGSLKKALR